MSLFASYKRKLKFFGVALGMFVATTANAAFLISDFNSGDQKVLQDTSSGLEWVRWNNTNNQGNVNVLLTQYSGFQLATAAQVLGLFANAGLPGTDTYFVPGSSTLGQSFAAFQTLIGFGNLQSGSNPVSYGTASDLKMYGYRHNVTPDTYDFFTQNSYTASTDPGADNSWALVRSITNNNVPEPASLALVALGLAGLARRKYKKQ